MRWNFAGAPVVKTLCFHCKGCGFDPWSGIPHATRCSNNNKKSNLMKVIRYKLSIKNKIKIIFKKRYEVSGQKDMEKS